MIVNKFSLVFFGLFFRFDFACPFLFERPRFSRPKREAPGDSSGTRVDEKKQRKARRRGKKHQPAKALSFINLHFSNSKNT